MNVEAERLASAVHACRQHAVRLREAMDAMAEHMPLTAATLQAADAAQVRTFDQFVYRFGKLQDTTGSQLFPATLTCLQEPIREASMRDRLNRLEQLRILSDVAAWNRIRAVRDRLAHEYPDAPERQAAVLNLAWQAAPELLSIVTKVAAHAEQSAGHGSS